MSKLIILSILATTSLAFAQPEGFDGGSDVGSADQQQRTPLSQRVPTGPEILADSEVANWIKEDIRDFMNILPTGATLSFNSDVVVEPGLGNETQAAKRFRENLYSHNGGILNTRRDYGLVCRLFLTPDNSQRRIIPAGTELKIRGTQFRHDINIIGNSQGIDAVFILIDHPEVRFLICDVSDSKIGFTSEVFRPETFLKGFTKMMSGSTLKFLPQGKVLGNN